MICPVCLVGELQPFIEIDQVPIHCNLLWPDRHEAVASPKGKIKLGNCETCGHIANIAFDQALMAYTQAYENSLHFSPRFQDYAQSLAQDLVERYNLYDKEIVELGSGQGDFLRMLCHLGHNYGFGFDEAYVPNHEIEEDRRVTFIQDFDWKKYIGHVPDMIYTRHVLEHIEKPKEFVANIRDGLGDDRNALVFMEMPNMAYTLQSLAIWDIIYEHCGYFTPQSLAYLFRHSGFEVLSISDTFGGQFLTIEAQPKADDQTNDRNGINNLGTLNDQIANYSQAYKEKVAYWRSMLTSWASAGKRVVAWGAGSKGVTFLNVLGTRERLSYIVDINPRKVGMFVAGTGQEIVNPDFLPKYNPDIVILMNPLYKEEIAATMAGMGLTPEIFIA